MLPVAPPRVLEMRARDGARLVADVWRPEAPGRFPVLLMRQLYGRRIASSVVLAHPAWYAAQGYVVAVQDVRGTGDSEGALDLFAQEAEDGADSVPWAADLPGSDGRVGLYGFSYQGIAALLSAGARPQAVASCMGSWDLRSDWAWSQGAFALAGNLGWGCQVGWLRARRARDAEAATAFEAACAALPLREAHRTLPEVMRRHGRHSHYADWLSHPGAGAYWEARAPRALLGGVVPVPALHVAAWQDAMLPGGLAAHDADHAGEKRLFVGPWGHIPWGRRVGALDLGDAACSPVDGMLRGWFDRQLKGIEDRAPGVTLFDIGTRAWREFYGWPGAEARRWFVAGEGLSAARSDHGRLLPDPRGAGLERFVHDPWRPVPVVGGLADRAGVDDRADVAVFTTAPFAAPVTLCGAGEVVLAASADAPSFDVAVALSVVGPEGRAVQVASGHARVDGTPGVVRVALRATCCTVAAGQAVRLSVAGAAFPAFAVNPGTGVAALDFTAEAERTVTIGIATGGASWLELPVMPA